MTNQECDYCYEPVFYAKHKGARINNHCPDYEKMKAFKKWIDTGKLPAGYKWSESHA